MRSSWRRGEKSSRVRGSAFPQWPQPAGQSREEQGSESGASPAPKVWDPPHQLLPLGLTVPFKVTDFTSEITCLLEHPSETLSIGDAVQLQQGPGRLGHRILAHCNPQIQSQTPRALLSTLSLNYLHSLPSLTPPPMLLPGLLLTHQAWRQPPSVLDGDQGGHPGTLA